MFLKDAELYGAKIQNGITMMIYQGKVAFELWTGKSVSQNLLKHIESKLSKLLQKI
jgi:shikimate dehydrogenase